MAEFIFQINYLYTAWSQNLDMHDCFRNWAYDGKGNFTPHLIGENQEAYDIRIVDLDQDGDFDLLVAGRASNNVAWYENPRQ